MSNFKTIEKLGLTIFDYKEPHHHFAVDAKELETLLQSAQVVYGSFCKRQDGKNTSEWSYLKSEYDTHTALVIGVTSIKKQTKTEAALEFVEKFKSRMLSHVGYLEAEKEAIRILEMKDEV